MNMLRSIFGSETKLKFMAEDPLSRLNLTIDDLNKLRILNPDIFQETVELRDQSCEFNKVLQEFQTAVASIVELVDRVSQQVEGEKLKALGTRNVLKSIKKQRETEQQQQIAILQEKMIENERLRIQLESLRREEAEQQAFINQFLLHE